MVVGPMSRDAVRRLLDLDTPVDFIQGNCEVAVLVDMAAAIRVRCRNRLALQSTTPRNNLIRTASG